MSVSSHRSENLMLRYDRHLVGISSKHEKLLLAALAARVPRSITPDHLTTLGIVGAVLAFSGLLLSNFHELALAVAFVGIALNWAGDSLDGTVARARNIERPRYGFYVDHVTDLASQLLIVIGLGLSPLMRLDCALLGLVGYLGLSVLSFIKLHVARHLQLSYFGIGPTEVRVAIASGIIFAGFVEMPVLQTSAGAIGLFDAAAIVILAFACTAGVSMFVVDSRKLAVVDPPRHCEAPGVHMTDVNQERTCKHAAGH